MMEMSVGVILKVFDGFEKCGFTWQLVHLTVGFDTGTFHWRRIRERDKERQRQREIKRQREKLDRKEKE